MNNINKNFIVYCYTNNINNKKYIGCTSKTTTERAGTDGKNYKGSPYFMNAIIKYGFSNFTVEILAHNVSRDVAASIEKFYIKKFNTIDYKFGYNLHKGGFRSNKLDFSEKKSIAAKISQTLKVQRSSPEYRKIMSARMHLVWHSDDSRKRMLSRKTNGGRAKVKIFCKTLNITFNSLKEAAICLGVSSSFLSVSIKKLKDIGRDGCSFRVYSKSHKIKVELNKIVALSSDR